MSDDDYQAQEAELIAKMVGMKVTNVRWRDPNAAEEWGDHGELVIEMENGYRLVVTSWGYDASAIDLNKYA